MLIWRGWGWMVPMLFVLGLVGGEFLTDTITGDAAYWPEHSWVQFVACLVVGGIVGVLGLALNVGGYQQHLTQGLPKKDFVSHTFMFVPLQYWGVLVPALGAYVVFFMAP